MSKLELRMIACNIMDDMNALNNGWSNYVEGLSYWDRKYVNRLVNNMIREEYY